MLGLLLLMDGAHSMRKTRSIEDYSLSLLTLMNKCSWPMNPDLTQEYEIKCFSDDIDYRIS